MKKLLLIPVLFLIFGNIRAQQVTLNKSTYQVGEAITVNFTGSTSILDWIALFNEDITPGNQNNHGWKYTSNTQTASATTIESGSVTFGEGLSAIGKYKVCLLSNDSYTVAATVNFEVVAQVPTTLTPVGEWLFNDPQDLLKSSVGPALELVGTHAAVSGPTLTDGAVRIGVGSHYKLVHGIAPNNGTKVNTYSLCYDFKVSSIGVYYSFLQTTVENNDDGEIFVDKTGHLGVRNTGYSPEPIVAGEWNRMVVVVNNGVEYSIYLNGVKFLIGVAQEIDGRFGLNPTALLMADEDGEDNEMDVARISIYNKALTEAEVASLGGVELVVPVDVPQTPLKPMVLVYPNPTEDFIKVQLANNETMTQLFLTDMLGRSVFTSNLKDSGSDLTIDVRTFPKGMYLLTLKGSSEPIVTKIVVK